MFEKSQLSSDHPPIRSARDTAQSWRVLKNLLPMSMALLASLITFAVWFSESYEDYDQPSQVANFKTYLKEYVTEVNRLNIFLSPPSRSVSSIDSAPGIEEQARRLENSIDSLSWRNKEKARAEFKLAVFQKYGVEFTSTELDDIEKNWMILSTWERLLKALQYTSIAFASTFVVAWLSVVLGAFLWWFLMDRLRDISRAVKGQ
jgi:hypothetical protein